MNYTTLFTTIKATLENDFPTGVGKEHAFALLGEVLRLDHLFVHKHQNKAIDKNRLENLRDIQIEAETTEIRFMEKSDSGIKMRSVDLG